MLDKRTFSRHKKCKMSYCVHKTAIASLLIPLSACVSSDNIGAIPIATTVHSQHSVNEVAYCLAIKYDVASHPSDDGSTVVLVKQMYGGLSMHFAIWPEQTGSRIDIRQGENLINRKFRQCF